MTVTRDTPRWHVCLVKNSTRQKVWEKVIPAETEQDALKLVPLLLKREAGIVLSDRFLRFFTLMVRQL